MVLEYISCDLETTGINPEKDKIIEIAMLRVVEGEVVETFSTLINPRCRVPLKIKRLTGIEDQELDQSPTLDQVMPKLQNFMIPLPLVGHNIEFDRSFLEAHLGPLPFTYCLDTLELARLVIPNASGHSLARLASQLGLAARKNHRALDDALTAVKLFNALLHKLESLQLDVLLKLLPLLKHARTPWAKIIEDTIKKRIKDLNDIQVSGKFPLKEPAPVPKASRILLNNQDDEDNYSVEKLLGPESPLAKKLPGYEYRAEQVKMAAAVSKTLAEKKILLVEAGTGTGKSLAYLLPALVWSLRNGQQAVVATNTINLQEQLWHKDIPLLQKLVDLPVRASILKGRANYLCLRRFFHLVDNLSSLTPVEAMLAARILVWLQTTDTGDKAELNLYGQDNDTWLLLCSESESCFGGGCRWHNRYCFVSRARRSAENSHILIINHALLFTDMTSEVKILPEHGVLVIDEAHHLEDNATMHLGKRVSRSEIAQWLSVAGKTIKKLRETAPPRDGKQWESALDNAEKARRELRDHYDTFFACLAGILRREPHHGFVQNKVRLHTGQDPLDKVRSEYSNFLYRMHSFLDALKAVAELLETWIAGGEPWDEVLQDVYSLSGRGGDYLANLAFILESPDENYVCWVEFFNAPSNGYVNCVLHATPIDVSTILHEQLFDTSRAIVLTSATLTVNGSFEHFMSRCGLNLPPKDAVTTGIMESPFDYERQCLLCVAENLPLLNDSNAEDYLDVLVETIYSLALETGGRTLVLFTSHKLLRDVYLRCRPLFEEEGICLLGHNLDGGRSKLIEEFTRDKRSVLFGTSSFWEGVDIPGDSLVSVIMVKLPFAPPDDPVLAARQEIIARQGRNSFYGLSLPQAVIRFKQGFGRLIRSKRDHGAVVILDKRIIEKRYGKVFLQSLPLKSHLRGEVSLIRKKLAGWIQS